MKKISKITNILIPILTIVVVVLLWFFAFIIVGEDVILPSPLQSVSKLWQLILSANFWLSLGGTLLRSFLAFVCAFIIAGSLAVLSKFFSKSRRVIRIIVAMLRALPTIAVVLLLLLWTTSRIAAIVVTMIVVIPVLYSSIIDSFGIIDSNILQMCKVYNLSQKVQFKSYIIPQILPITLENIGRGLAFNIKLMVASEVLAGTANSIGLMMSQSKIYFETAELFALVVVTVLIAIIIESVMMKITRIVEVRYGSR